ncbi:hypothetical protein [Pseudomonas sp. HMWF006]|uniref:hypothetical protein n=1 Tax=Pseudomonas sp. HMWF006 TaxID=2056843 RepID=UPI000FFC2742|nr:hypothetical protein [Pseudomonas sp. HMWF006]
MTAGSWSSGRGQTGVAGVKKRSGKYEKTVTQGKTAINPAAASCKHLINDLRDARFDGESDFDAPALIST